MLIIPHGLLHQTPFHALYDGRNYLLEGYEISYAPSAMVYALCRNKRPKENGRALALGVSDGRIPHAAAEATAVSQHLPGAALLLDETATVNALKEQSAGCDVLHLACHGLFRGDNPMFSALKLRDGWLTANEALQLDLDGALVALNLPAAHAISQGAGAVVAVLDTGAQMDHPLRAGIFPAVTADFVDGDAHPDDAFNGLDDDGDGVVDEAAGHGTHIAGIVHMAAPQAQIMPVRVLDSDGRGTCTRWLKLSILPLPMERT